MVGEVRVDKMIIGRRVYRKLVDGMMVDGVMVDKWWLME